MASEFMGGKNETLAPKRRLGSVASNEREGATIAPGTYRERIGDGAAESAEAGVRGQSRRAAARAVHRGLPHPAFHGGRRDTAPSRYINLARYSLPTCLLSLRSGVTCNPRVQVPQQ
ncbi:unnamed protein product [Parnassius apollo]|uniref:(apollo) hypothetical protein n=1 Tax=Parnassius apollo TaxID=110799 RepID=A0A8S3XWV9_PARAO|nr:unnamed protein product [Parnassius apollo]